MQRLQLPHEHNASWLKDILLLSLVLGGLFFILLGSRPLFVPDEGRYAEIAREMVASGDYVTPYLNGIKYFEKPALFYWLEAAAIHLGGLNLWSIRSVNAILGLLCCLLTYCSCRKLYNRNTGLLAAFILGTSSLFFVMVHMASLDLPVTFFLSLTLYTFLLGVQQPQGNTRRFYLWTASFAAACAVLTKGLIGIVFPAMIIATWIAISREWRMLLRLYLPSSLLIFLLVVTPWHVIVSERNPEFFYFYFINQQFLRYTMLKIGHYQPVWFFIPALIVGFFPWIVFLPQALTAAIKSIWQNEGTSLRGALFATKQSILAGLLRRKKRSSQRQSSVLQRPDETFQQDHFNLFFLLWTVLIFIFFSLSKSKLIPYILPIFPPLSVLTARYLQSKKSRGMNIGFAGLLLASILIAVVFFLFPQHISLPDPQTASHMLYPAAIILLLGAFIACIFHSRHLTKALTTTIATTCLFLLFSFASMPAIDTRTILPLANQLKVILTPQDEVVAYNQYFQDLPFYLQRRITILNWQNEMTYGMAHQDASEWMIRNRTFWQRWQSHHRMFAFMGKKEYQQFVIRYAKEPHYLISQTLNTVLISNQKPEQA